MQADTLIRRLKFISKDWWEQQDKVKTTVFLIAVFVYSTLVLAGHWVQIGIFYAILYASKETSAWYSKGSRYITNRKKKEEEEIPAAIKNGPMLILSKKKKKHLKRRFDDRIRPRDKDDGTRH